MYAVFWLANVCPAVLLSVLMNVLSVLVNVLSVLANVLSVLANVLSVLVNGFVGVLVCALAEVLDDVLPGPVP